MHSQSCDMFFEPLEDRRLFSAVRIMPLGDSITESFAPRESYRYWLWNELQSAGYTNIDFVGSQHGVLGGQPADPNFDQDHEGHSGWTAGQILQNITAWANLYVPDIVIMHLGTNDMRDGESISTTLNDFSGIIDDLRAANPRVTILVSQIIPNDDAPGLTQQLNAAIPGFVASEQDSNSRLIVVDQWTGFDLQTDSFDGLHPDQSGEQKMAAKYFSALRTVLPSPLTQQKSSTTYLSKLTASYSANGFGPVELDESNGGENAHDGEQMSIGGQTFDHGLGVNSDSRIEYKLNGRQTYFSASLGIDDETGGSGTVVFKVYADGKRIFCSAIITGDDPLVSLKLNIHGVHRLVLIVNDGGDNTDDDHADWADARLSV